MAVLLAFFLKVLAADGGPPPPPALALPGFGCLGLLTSLWILDYRLVSTPILCCSFSLPFSVSSEFNYPVFCTHACYHQLPLCFFPILSNGMLHKQFPHSSTLDHLSASWSGLYDLFPLLAHDPVVHSYMRWSFILF